MKPTKKSVAKKVTVKKVAKKIVAKKITKKIGATPKECLLKDIEELDKGVGGIKQYLLFISGDNNGGISSVSGLEALLMFKEKLDDTISELKSKIKPKPTKAKPNAKKRIPTSSRKKA